MLRRPLRETLPRNSRKVFLDIAELNEKKTPKKQEQNKTKDTLNVHVILSLEIKWLR